MPSPADAVHRYHDGTKHHFARFARSLGYLDWASQPHPFRTFAGAPRVPLFPSPDSEGGRRFTPAFPAPTYADVLDGRVPVQPLTAAAVGDLLRHSLGLSAWKAFGDSRWSLRVNPSSGNLHPTEAYVVCGPIAGLCAEGAVFHYAAETHAIERRCRFSLPASVGAAETSARSGMLVALTSIHWREAWKYGERAFRYCQHDLGHAMAAIAFAAAALGWRVDMAPAWSHGQIAALVGADRDADYVEAEREEPACVLVVCAQGDGDLRDRFAPPIADLDPSALVAAVRAGSWSGRASQLSGDHVQWTFIDEIAAATIDPGRPGTPHTAVDREPPAGHGSSIDVRQLFLQRRSALAFDGVGGIGADVFFTMLARVRPSARAPWTALWWRPRIHLLLFVHRVGGVAPGLYAFARDDEGFARLRGAVRREMLWERAHESLPLWCLARGDCRSMARRLSCDQEFAADGFFSLGMLADFDAALVEQGPSFYRHLFWESGVIGQQLYLEAEAAGGRGSGIGCFYDDPVHDVLGLDGHAFQSLYHFTIGAPVEDRRLLTEPGYAWERRGSTAASGLERTPHAGGMTTRRARPADPV